jgi:hypothetical protein
MANVVLGIVKASLSVLPTTLQSPHRIATKNANPNERDTYHAHITKLSSSESSRTKHTASVLQSENLSSTILM